MTAGHVVPHKPKSKPFEAVAPSPESEFSASRPPPPKSVASAVPKSEVDEEGRIRREIIVKTEDFPKLVNTAQTFLDKEDESKAKHKAKLPAPKEKTRAEKMGFLSWSFPPDFGPDAPDWDEEKWNNFSMDKQIADYEAAQARLEAKKAEEEEAARQSSSTGDGGAVDVGDGAAGGGGGGGGEQQRPIEEEFTMEQIEAFAESQGLGLAGKPDLAL